MSDQPNHVDAIIIGGGPAGSAVRRSSANTAIACSCSSAKNFRATTSANRSSRSLSAARAHRHDPEDEGVALVKNTASPSCSRTGARSRSISSTATTAETVAQTWQVLRSEFDQMLLDNAREKGAEVREETTVNRLLMDGDACRRRRGHGQRTGRTYEVRAPITLDCSGKEAFTANTQGWRMRDPYLNKIAVWTYYTDSKRDAGIDEGDTTVAYVPDKGWFWHIPQHDDMISVGVVAEGKYLTRDGVKARGIFHREVEENLWIKDHLSAGEQVGQYFITSEYSATRVTAPRGASARRRRVRLSRSRLQQRRDARAQERPPRRRSRASGARQAKLLAGALRAIRRLLRQGVENMRKLVYAFYDPKFSFTRHRAVSRRGRRNHRLPLGRREQGLQPALEKSLRVCASARGFTGGNSAFGPGQGCVASIHLGQLARPHLNPPVTSQNSELAFFFSIRCVGVFPYEILEAEGLECEGS